MKTKSINPDFETDSKWFDYKMPQIDQIIKLTRLFDTDEQLFKKYRFREYESADTVEICSWVDSKAKLAMVSGDIAEKLTPSILNTWIINSYRTIVVIDELDQPIAFCTMSRKESIHLSDLEIELCHLIVNPKRKFFSAGSYLCHIAKSIASNQGYKYLKGRIVFNNRFGAALAIHHSFKICPTRDLVNKYSYYWVKSDL